MAKITFHAPDGDYNIDAPENRSLMDAAINNDVPGIVAECGGAASCGTCHVLVEDRFTSRVGAATGLELDMLVAVADDVRPNSRLACQVTVTADLDGLHVEVVEL